MVGVASESLRIAMVGCGAVAERGHLPAITKSEGCHISLLVDSTRQRADELASKFDVENTSTAYEDIAGLADAAVVAVPHNLHAEVTTALLRRGLDVLVEKPMATTVAECQQMIAAAEQHGRILTVGHMRRFLHNARLARWVVQAGVLGPIKSFDFHEGNVYNWPVQSASFFNTETAGGGVLVDAGAHVLDLLLWWFGEVEEIEYRDDNFGGVEADCLLRLETASGIPGTVGLSRTRDLRNTVIVYGENATLEVHLRQNWAIIHSTDGSVGLNGLGADSTTIEGTPQGFSDLFEVQIEDFLGAIRDGRPPTVSGVEATQTVALIERCYAERKPLEMPWLQPAKEVVSA